MTSLRTRLLSAASVVLAVFVLLSGAALEEAFRSSAEEVQQDKLQGLVYALLGAAESGESEQLAIPEGSIPDPRLSRPESGLEALILDARGKVIWQSPNLAGPLPPLRAPEVGATLFSERPDSFVLCYGVRWAADVGSAPKPRRYTVAVIEDKSAYTAQLNTFRRTLWIGLGGAAVTLLVLQFAVLRWGLEPLARLAAELRRVEGGEQAQIESQYPDELNPLTAGLNAMILAERNQQSRYRNALDDLAHSLKTPLAVLQGLAEDHRATPELGDRLHDSVSQIRRLADHQLRKAATAGRRSFSEPVQVRPLAEKIGGALAKVYADKHIVFEYEIVPMMRARVDEGDFYELLGNLMDNAGKWCKNKIRVTARLRNRLLQVQVDDDGPGFPAEAANLLERGARADTKTPGQGIGLGAVAELVRVYEGSIQLGRSELGGARVEVQLSI
jgi:two-component system sensor histidine kinase PhoQ